MTSGMVTVLFCHVLQCNSLVPGHTSPDTQFLLQSTSWELIQMHQAFSVVPFDKNFLLIYLSLSYSIPFLLSWLIDWLIYDWVRDLTVPMHLGLNWRALCAPSVVLLRILILANNMFVVFEELWICFIHEVTFDST